MIVHRPGVNRRHFLLTSLAGALAAPRAVEIVHAGMPRVGFLSASTPTASPHLLRAFRDGLREVGYVEGRTITVEYRWADGRLERLPDLAADLVRLRVDVIVAANPQSIEVAKAATTSIPIVMGLAGDPVASGFVASLARPGGNITGPSAMAPHVVGKQLELLREVRPGVSRVGVLWNSGHPTGKPQWQEAELVAGALQLRLLGHDVGDADRIDRAFTTMKQARVEALLVLVDQMLLINRSRVVELAARHRLPAVYWAREFVDSGGLMTYSSNMVDLLRRAATYVDRILKGAKPADLPIEQPTRFELVINLKTAKALGLTIPPSLLARADQVIE